jgi:two-component system sensor kinase FixL
MAMEINELRQALIHLSRVTTVGELAAALTHELAQPLCALQINAEATQAVLEPDRPDLNKARAILADIVTNNQRAIELIQTLRTLFRRERGSRAIFDPVEALTESSKIVETDARNRKIAFLVEIRRPLPMVVGERIQLEQAIINIVLNAFDAVSEVDSIRRHVILRAASERPGSVNICVKDSGKGMEPGVIERIFEPFFSTKINGIGMGLSISKSIIESHGGHISVSSEAGNGTLIEIEIPSQDKTSSVGLFKR